MLCLGATMVRALFRAFYSIREEHMFSKGNRSNARQSHGEMGANEGHYYFAKDSQDYHWEILDKRPNQKEWIPPCIMLR